MPGAKKQIKKITITSKIENIKIIDKLIDDVFYTFNLSQTLYGNVLISVHEAVSNAILHGNNKNPNKKVYIEFKLENECLIVSVEDEGNGFDYTKLPNPTKEKNKEKLFGRGIFLISSLTNKYEFKKNGKKIILHFNYKEQLNRINLN